MGGTPAESGRFTGLTLREAMERASETDIRAFLGYVSDFPAKYIGHPYRFVEAYVAWLVGNAPVSPGEFRERMLAIEDAEERRIHLVQVGDKLENYLAKWYKNFDELEDSAGYEEARQIVDLMLLASEVLDQYTYYAVSYFALGSLLDNAGKYSESVGAYKQALNYHIKADDLINQAYTLNNIAQVYTKLEKYETALEFYQDALGYKKKVKTQASYESQAHTYSGIGETIHYFGLIMVPTANLAEVYSFTGEYDRATALIREALRLAEDMKAESRLVEFIQLLGKINRLQGRFASAEKTLEKALAAAKKLGLTVTRVNIQTELGIVAYEREDYKKARKLLARTSASARQLSLPGSLWESLYYLGLTHRERGDDEKAMQALQESVEVLERMRSKIAGGESAESRFQADKLQVYRALIDLLSRVGRGEEAFKYIGLMKSQELSNIATRSLADFEDDPDKKELFERAQSFQGREFELVRLLKEEQRKSRGEQRGKLIERWHNELDQIRLEFGDFRRRLEQDHPDIYRSLQIEPADLRRLQRNLQADEVFIEPVVLPDRIVTFVVRGGSGREDSMLPPLVFRQIEVRKDRVDNLLRQMRQGLENVGMTWSGARGTRLAGKVGKAGEEDPTQASQELYALLIEPLHALLDSVTTLIVSPSGRLRYIPFQALHDGERFLIEKHRIAVVTRVGAFKPHQTIDIAQTGILALANPDGSLEAAEAEVRAIREIWRPFEAYYGPEATMENLRDNARYYPILHLATHGVLRNDQPQESFLLMAGADGGSRLTFREIPLLPLSWTYLATLSACQTALGDKGEGSEISGLAYEFEQQGAATVVASLWAVNDASTADFMIEFYSKLRLPEVSKAEALQAAQLKLLSSPETQHPYFWAPFIMIGDWRK